MDIQDHAPTGAICVLPADFVVGALKSGLEVLTQGRGSKVDPAIQCVVRLQTGQNGCQQLILVITMLGSLSVEYSFVLAPITIDKVDLVDCKVRDVQEALPPLTKSVETMLAAMETTQANTVAANAPVVASFV
ncbi:Aste57867_23766 [Aphanomyces stellatus]|uniref:Aste57867_23766 protein n=1 Tax=Aphanomyces stellatus TaxID=120398 RepID=A0A485LNJ0_9STRA|nr:hypothetical protein As57867_023693 [Aphanomyces stellatus]VFU00411.1 Aste57867_23766 [Aphanomyces stellatus]